jgi:hypothetical protein
MIHNLNTRSITYAQSFRSSKAKTFEKSLTRLLDYDSQIWSING